MSTRERVRMTDDEIRRYLQGARAMTLVTNGRRGHPHPMPMFYGLDADLTVRFSTYGASQKVRNIERDPRVSLLVDSGDTYGELRGVMIEGHAEIVHDLEATVATMIEAMGRAGEPLPPADQLSADVKQQMAGKRVLIRVRPERFISWDHAKLAAAKTPSALR